MPCNFRVECTCGYAMNMQIKIKDNKLIISPCVKCSIQKEKAVIEDIDLSISFLQKIKKSLGA